MPCAGVPSRRPKALPPPPRGLRKFPPLLLLPLSLAAPLPVLPPVRGAAIAPQEGRLGYLHAACVDQYSCEHTS